MNAHDELIWSPTNELYHHGIRGQKWGQKNGPPYPLDSSDHSAAEKKASGGSSGSGSDSQSSKVSLKDRIFKKSSSSKSDSDDKEKTKAESSTKPKKTKSVKNMTDEELNAAIKRAELEKKYSDLTSPKEEKKTSLGESVTKGLVDVGGSILSKSLTNIGTQTLTYILGTEVNKQLDKYNKKKGIDDNNSINPKKGQKDK